MQQKLQAMLLEELQFYPGIAEEKCTGCKSCLACCKERVIAFDEGARKCRIASPGKCRMECRTCASVCPAGAVTFPDEEKFIAYLRQRLTRIKVEMDRLESALCDNRRGLH